MQMAMHRQARLCNALTLTGLHRSNVAEQRQRHACQVPWFCLGMSQPAALVLAWHHCNWSALQWQEAAVGARAVQRSAAGSSAAEGQLAAQALVAAM